MDEPKDVTVKAKLLNYKIKDGYYILVFENQDSYDSYLEKYFWVAVPPGWSNICLEIGETVMLNYVMAKAGQMYYKANNDSFFKYKNTINWYKDSIPLNHVVSKKVIID